MDINYHEDTDSLYIHFNMKPSVESEEVAPSMVLDFDEDGNVTGIEVYSAARDRIELSKVRVSGLDVENELELAYLP